MLKITGVFIHRGRCCRLIAILCGLCLCFLASAQNNPDRLNYIEKYKDIAISEMQRAGVPASIKLAQAILESNSGKSVLARKAKNHFGMKCGSTWTGKTYYREDDDYDEAGNLRPSCFRVYKDAEASFVAHSEFLRDPRKHYRYGFLFRLDPKDYRRWALGLKKAGYATNPYYPDLLIRLIEEYELYVYDNMSLNDIVPVPPDLPSVGAGQLLLVNNIRTTLGLENETVVDIAERTEVRVDRLIKYNEKLRNPSQKVDKDYRVFLQPKRGNFQGRRKYHYVKEQQSLFDISQLYGVRLEKLYKKNRIPEGKEPAIGQKIKLRGWRVSKKNAPQIRKRGEDTLPPATLPVRDLEQDEEVDFDVEVPPTAIEDFETPKPDTGTPTGTSNPTPTSPPVVTTPTPSPDTSPTTTPPPPVVTPNASTNFYTVQAGDTLYRLSKRFDTTVARLKQLNGITSNIITIGQRLRIR